MEPLNDTDIKKRRLALIISIASAVLLLGVLVAFLFFNNKLTNKNNAAAPHQANTKTVAYQSEKKQLTDVLQKRLADLKRESDNFITASATGEKMLLDSMEKLVTVGEEALQASIDSVWIDAVAGRKTEISQLDNLNAYRRSLDSIKLLNKTVHPTVIDKNFVPDGEAFIRLRNELMEKTNKIALLESSIETMSKQASSNFAGADGGKIKEASNANAVLLENKVDELTAVNQRLQQEIERLRKQPAEASKSNSTEQILLSKNTALQQKVNAINAELQLVKVDCNLSRADATQIISNSKQRKQLLAEASGILTDLSANSDAEIRSKVREKIVRLNQVAANTRD